VSRPRRSNARCELTLEVRTSSGALVARGVRRPRSDRTIDAKARLTRRGRLLLRGSRRVRLRVRLSLDSFEERWIAAARANLTMRR
jgi:hypothetical protein